MTPHFIWAGVVLVLAAGGFVVARARWRNLERLSGGLDGLACRVDQIGRLLDDLTNEEHQTRGRVVTLETKVRELEPVVKALSAVPKGVPRVRTI